MNKSVTVTVNGVKITAQCGTLISDILNMEEPCGGHARCGKCKLYAFGALSEPSESEKKILTEYELASGVRLACCTQAIGDCTVKTSVDARNERIVIDSDLPKTKIRPAFKNYGVAVDIGTTTVAAKLFDTNGAMLSQACGINSQQRWGADVISRIEASLSGHSRDLAYAIRQMISELITELSMLAGVDAKDIDGAVITGNSVMLSLLAEESVLPFSAAPFSIERRFGETLSASDLCIDSLSPEAKIYLPPCISAFVGADVSCAILATGLTNETCAMLTDIGTNGEIALINKGNICVCSTAAGPAFEGVGIKHGMRAATGAIDRVCTNDDAIEAHVIGDCEAVGICGSGLIDAAAALLELGILEESGYLEDEEFAIVGSVTVTQNDIRMLQLAKSAVCAGIVTLVKSENLSLTDVGKLFVAGGFGNYLSSKSAANIGLLPKALAKRAKAVGNAALAGASMLLLDKELICEIERIASYAKTVNLHENTVFSENYMNGMIFCEV